MSAFAELEAVYAGLEEELARLRPRCDLSGRCCRFGEFGHQLWTTRLELDYLLAREGDPPSGDGTSCPWLKEGRCGARGGRMLGCRIYFCDPAYAAAMGPLYEKYHAKIKEIHRARGIAYEYSEFLGALEA